MLARASELEGHPDNVAAAIYGGFVICGPGEGARPSAARFDPPGGLEGIAVIPAEEVSTERARAAIPAEVPLADAVANVSAASRLVLGLQRADLDLVAAGLADRIHQPRRRELYPRSMELVDARRELGALGATISGAGPTVLVWTTWQDAGKVAEALEAALRRLGRGSPPSLQPPRRRRTRALSMDLLVQIGLIELALGGILGWAMVILEEKPEWLKRIGIIAPARIRQIHLDYVMMGLIRSPSASRSPTSRPRSPPPSSSAP